jgi:hypothetical protein
MPVMQRLIEDMSVADLKGLILRKKAMDRAEPLRRKLAKLQKAVEKIQQKIDSLLGGKAAGRRGRPRKARRGRPSAKGRVGRPPKAGRKPGRPAKKAGRKMSAAAKKRVALAVSKAQKARWAAFHKAKAAKAKKATKASQKPAKAPKKTPSVSPKAGTLAAKIEKVAGSEPGQA